MAQEMKKVVIGEIFVQDNIDRKFGADNQYASVWVRSGESNIPLLLTKREFDNAIRRGIANLEDIPQLGSEASVNPFDKE